MFHPEGLAKSAGSEGGQALILIVFAIIGLVGVTALAVDGGSAYADRRQAQNAADSAALSGGLARIRGEDWVQAALASAAINGYDNNGVSNNVEARACNGPDADCGVYTGNVEYIKVAITSNVRAYFAQVIGRSQITNRVEAIVHTKPPEYKEMVDGNAVVSLAPTSNCTTKKSFWIHGEATLNISGAGIFVNSNNQTCAFIQQGSGSVILRDEYEISIVGKDSTQKPKLITPYPPRTGAAALSYPPPFYMPKVGCTKEAVVSEDGQSMSAGSWGEDFPPLGVNSLESGIYCLGGDFIVGGGVTLQGNNVVFKVEEGSVRWSGDAEINLKGRKAGPLAGLLLYLPPENNSRVVLNGNHKSSTMGAILAPGADIHINGMDSDSGFHSQIIGYRVDVNGMSNIVIKYQDDQNYDALTFPEIQLTK